MPYKVRDPVHAAIVALEKEQAEPSGFVRVPVEPPLIGRWHHGAGNLVSGGVRVARWDCDNNPPDEFRDRLLSWMCDTMNAAVDEWEKVAPDEFAAAPKEPTK